MSTHPVGLALAASLSREWGESVDVVDIRRLSGGASMETWLANVVDAGGERQIVLRRDRPGAPTSSRADEATLLRLAGEAGVPVPAVLAHGGDDELEQAWLVMEFLEGETIPRKLLRDQTFEEARPRVVGEVGAALARMHTIDADAVGFLGEPQDPLKSVDALAAAIQGYGYASPILELTVRWLRDNVPPSRPLGLVHGDVRNGNLMVGPDGLVAVLDWELAHVGQVAEDLGWFCVRAWRFGIDALPAGGFGTREQLLAAYVGAGGAEIGPEELRFWEIFGTLKWGVTCLAQLDVHLSGRARSVELAAIGRRVSEVEYDLVLLLEEATHVPHP